MFSGSGRSHVDEFLGHNAVDLQRCKLVHNAVLRGAEESYRASQRAIDR